MVRYSEQTIASFSPRGVYALLAMSIGLWLCWDSFVFELSTYSPYSDYWEHSALLTEWLRNLSNPINPHVLDDSLSPRYMPWFWALTWFGGIFGLDAVNLMGVSGVVSYALIVAGIYLFFREYFKHAWAPVVGFIVLFCGWGVSWNWSNLYQLRSFFYVAGFPSSFVFGLSLISFWLTLRVARSHIALLPGSIALLVMAALMFLCHPLTGVFSIFGCGLLTITEPGVALKQRFSMLLGLLIGSFIVELWPYFSVWEVTLGASGGGTADAVWGASSFDPVARFKSGVWMHIFYTPKYLVAILGLGWLCIGAWCYLLLKRRDPFILLGGAAMMVPYFAHLVLAVPLAHRFLLFAIFFFHMAGIRLVLDVLQRWFAVRESAHVDTRLRSTVYGLAVLFACAGLFNVALLAAEFTGRHLTPQLQVVNKFGLLPEGKSVIELYDRLTQQLGPYDVVMAAPDVAWPLPTVRGKTVSLYHENPMLTDQFTRMDSVAEFFTLGTSAARREAILARYQVKFVLLKGPDIPPNFARWLETIADPVARVGVYTMYRLNTPQTDG